MSSFQGRRVPKGESDPVTLNCNCGNNGTVLLFYRYTPVQDPQSEAEWLLTTCTDLHLTGKIRVGKEGFNITVGGQTIHTSKFIHSLIKRPYFNDITLTSIPDFFKPSPGCSHCFQDLSVKIVDEICPFGAKVNINQPHRTVSPAEFHELLQDPNFLLLDVRNHYESRMGAFKGAILPPIRRFSSLPMYLQQRSEMMRSKEKILTYCTGGIRCEKASRWIESTFNVPTIMLQGGIHKYLEWCAENGKESLFQGKNYVFDARLAVGMDTFGQMEQKEMSECPICHHPFELLFLKCAGDGCHLVIPKIYCCKDNVCCESCIDLKGPRRPLCDCEKERRQQLYGLF